MIPESFDNEGLNNEFSSVLISHSDIKIHIETFSHVGRHKALVTISREMAMSSAFYFYFNNPKQSVTSGTQYILKLKDILKDVDAKKIPGDGDEALSVGLSGVEKQQLEADIHGLKSRIAKAKKSYLSTKLEYFKDNNGTSSKEVEEKIELMLEWTKLKSNLKAIKEARADLLRLLYGVH
ncbi:hypothetical protein BVX99_03450 [bacterium F16]|nr:hypothetical protein BVX99_03450 [bacterium F16]